MGPRFLQRGNRLFLMLAIARKMASMGPRFLQRGNQGDQGRMKLSWRLLQWGHAFYSVEISESHPSIHGIHRLQWGHAFYSVEITTG